MPITVVTKTFKHIDNNCTTGENRELCHAVYDVDASDDNTYKDLRIAATVYDDGVNAEIVAAIEAVLNA